MKAIIIAGGNGSRLRKYSFENTKVPKPLLKIGNIPLLDIILYQLSYHGFNEIIISTRFKSEIIKEHITRKKNLTKDIKVRIIKEDKPLGTIGPISLIKGVNEPFLVMHGDLLTDLDFSKLFEFHKRKKGTLTLAVMKTKIQPLGIIKTEANIIKRYDEKPSETYLDSMSIFVCEPRILDYLEKNNFLNLDQFINQLAGKERVIAYHSEGKIIDIGTDEEYEKANAWFLNNKEKFIKKDNE